MSKPLYKPGEFKHFMWHKQYVSMEILAVKRKILFPWCWKYLVKYISTHRDGTEILYRTNDTEWVGERRIIP